jgi:hypothetical protein
LFIQIVGLNLWFQPEAIEKDIWKPLVSKKTKKVLKLMT